MVVFNCLNQVNKAFKFLENLLQKYILFKNLRLNRQSVFENPLPSSARLVFSIFGSNS